MVLKWFKSWRKKKQDKIDYNLTCCYDKDGVKLYKFHNPLKLPTVRRLMLFQAIHDAALGVNRNDLYKLLDLSDEYFNKGMFAQQNQCNAVLRAYLDQHSNTNSIFDTANCLILMTDESIDEMTPETIEKKRQLFDSNPDVRAFFLRMGYAYLMSFSNKSSLHLNIVDYLSQTAVKRAEAQFLNLITRNTEAGMKKMQTSKSTASQKEQAKP